MVDLASTAGLEANTQTEGHRWPLIRLRAVGKFFGQGALQVNALTDIDLDIAAGDFVAVVGASGSGKSTLMNVMGCLDQSDIGQYWFNGVDVSTLTLDALAALRRDRIGFVFQDYELIGHDDALHNVALPAHYAAQPLAWRLERAAALLANLGLGQRQHHRPTQLSGGEQQRVSIARALMNGGQLILADEPTGALDSRSASHVIGSLRSLAQQGHTVVLITHDKEVAAQAARVIELSDGRVLKDTRHGPLPQAAKQWSDPVHCAAQSQVLESVKLAAHVGWRSLWAHKFRTLLTVTGIVVGVATLMLMLAMGEGTRRATLDAIGTWGGNLIKVMPGNMLNSQSTSRQMGSDSMKLFNSDQLKIIEQLGLAQAVAPVNSQNALVNSGYGSTDASLLGTSEAYQQVADLSLLEGRFITARDVTDAFPVIVLDARARKKLWPLLGSVVGKWVMLATDEGAPVPMQVVGVVKDKDMLGASTMKNGGTVFLPWTSLSLRFNGYTALDITSMHVLASDFNAVPSLKAGLQQALLQARGKQDFSLIDMAEIIETSVSIDARMNLLLACLAVVSLVVGGVGLMNMQLVSVVERTREIGIRMAVGARGLDIQLQFLIEAMFTGVMGGVIGVVFGYVGILLAQQQEVVVAFSVVPALMGLSSAILVALIFGWIPARRAAALRPVQALAHR